MKISYAITPFPAVRSNRNSSWTPRAQEYHEKMNHLRALANLHKDIIKQALVGDRCSITFVMPVSDSWSKKKKEEALGQYHKQKPDTDNLYKAVLDTFFYKSEVNDCEVSFICARKVWGEKGEIIFEIFDK